MPKVGQTRTLTKYADAVQLAQGAVLTGATVVAVLSALGIASGLGAGSSLVVTVVNMLSGKRLSQYKVKFVITEKYVYERVFDTHEWIDAYMWKLVSIKPYLIKK